MASDSAASTQCPSQESRRSPAEGAAGRSCRQATGSLGCCAPRDTLSHNLFVGETVPKA